MSNADPINIVRPRPTNTHISAVRERTRGESPGSVQAARDAEAQEIARDILAEAFSTLRIRVLKPEAVAKLRAEVKRRVDGLRWARAA